MERNHIERNHIVERNHIENIKRNHMEIYVHIPFCKKKCAYCDFLSAPADEDTIGKYVWRLCREMAYYKNRYDAYEVDSIFIGGGTPSILTERQITRVMDSMRDHYRIAETAEISMECNPGTLDRSKADAMFRSGINRISFGLQSADNRELRKLGRIHTWEKFLESYALAKQAGFENINIDLMSALPGQTPDSWERTLKKVLELEPSHISAYSLIIEEGTPFYDLYAQDEKLRERGEKTLLLPTEEEERMMYSRTKEILSENGYRRYEISNYAKDGFACRHNIGYWTRKNYLGFGLGSSSLIGNVRFQNTQDMGTYMQQSFAHENRQVLDQTEQMEEFMFLGLRMMQGISCAEFKEQFGTSVEAEYGDALRELIRQELLTQKEDQIRLTEQGIDVSNYVFTKFLH